MERWPLEEEGLSNLQEFSDISACNTITIKHIALDWMEIYQALKLYLFGYFLYFYMEIEEFFHGEAVDSDSKVIATAELG